jgi:glycosyltransferase involved in cell wall biosynthesis
MKIAILSLQSRFGNVTGDCVQAEKTAEALRRLGEDASRFYLDQNSGLIFDYKNEKLGYWSEVFKCHDIVHAIPPIPSKFLSKLPKLKAKLVCSTVFWRSLTYTKVLQKNEGRLSLAIVKEYIRDFLAMIHIRLLSAYKVYDLLLPNSEDEIRVLKKYAKLKSTAEIVAVPNAIDPIPDTVDGLGRSSLVPDGDYVLVPGFFAARKNQATLIRALQNFAHPVVFMGKGPILEKCKMLANNNMVFIGHIDHGTDEFYSIMKYAKIVCLPSNCETPGIAGLEAAALGARPVVPYEGGTCQYYGWDAEYHNPMDESSLLTSVESAWEKGRLLEADKRRYASLTWDVCAEATRRAYSR